jgi:DNA-binding NtrC family response regulator
VLVVDDDPVVGEAVEALLALEGAAPHRAATVKDAVRVATSLGSELAVVLLDLRLGDGSGEALFDELETRRLAPGVVLMTGVDSAEADATAAHRAAAGVLAKPFDAEALVAAVTRAAAGRAEPGRPKAGSGG